MKASFWVGTLSCVIYLGFDHAQALGVDSPFFSTIVLFKIQLFPQGVGQSLGWFFRKKGPWKDWK